MHAKESLASFIPFEFIIFSWNHIQIKGMARFDFITFSVESNVEEWGIFINFYVKSHLKFQTQIVLVSFSRFFPWNRLQIHWRKYVCMYSWEFAYLICNFFVKSISINFLWFSGLPHVPINWSYQLFQMPSRNSFWPTSHGL